ncbi:enoyl-CoA hydratase/isomerase family protein [Actinomadura sp. HBU206391]|uniref:enoyl-CoA hydratase/isomerase family protein n=1 Tax=Actinomadura sp. HBU206391 TaxID=2731692 RepID=UPI001650B4DA|nr:enoyl-CoA hydratase/isomerase family protein [Actinomadura sp. HBU206391]MBC6459440.1 enoyl-CoA hydratase/isomerase family protein [Actinomadura sp. HBU206391]
MSDLIELDRTREDRLVVTLNRPERRNALDRAMIDALHDVCSELEERPRLAILTGQEGVFAGGADIAELRDRGVAEALEGINLRLFERLRRVPMPTIAAIDGWALGGGAELAYACDFRLATPRAVFGQPEVGLGIVAGAGAAYRLPRLVGESLAKDILMTGRRLTAAEAYSAGLLHSVPEPADLMDAAHRLCDRLAAQAPLALRLTKLAIDAPDAAHPAVEMLAQAVLFTDQDKHDRMTAFLDRGRKRS